MLHLMNDGEYRAGLQAISLESTVGGQSFWGRDFVSDELFEPMRPRLENRA